jgi:3-keto-disaccharide hydrolase
MGSVKIVFLAAMFVLLVSLQACRDDDEDEKQKSKPASTAAAQPTQQKSEAKDADEDEEGAPGSAAVAGEKPAPVQAAGQQLAYNFDNDPVGAPPAKFHSARTGQGSESKWAVMADPTAPSKPNVAAQTSTDKTDYRFPLLIADEGSFRDLDISVKFKAVSGSVDQAAGLVFRLKDANNYYVVRANALEDNYRLYHVVNGSRKQFAGANFKVTSGAWHELRVEATGNKFTCYFDGTKKIEATDDTFKDAGKVGLWTKADSVTYFDDLRVTAR